MDESLNYKALRQAEVTPEALPTPGPADAVVRTNWSGISRGTERLIFHGRVPPAEFERMRAPFQEGDFPFPVKYGYAAVGTVEEGPSDLLGRAVFALFPHQTRFVIPAAALTPVPERTPPRRAVLAANTETALNGVWDGGVSPGDKIAIVGAGVLGGLLAGLCGALPGAETTLIDLSPARADLAAAMNARFATPDMAHEIAAGADVVFHTSASEAGLNLALSLAGPEATVVEMSWFGAAAPRAPLGEAFHSQRLKLISSQVGQVSPHRRVRWPHQRRLAKALDLLSDDRYDALLTEDVAFHDLPAALPRLLADPDPKDGAPPAGLATVVRYPPMDEPAEKGA